MAAKYKVVMIRNGESEWNKKNKFCGWFDAELSIKGLKEVKEAGEALKDAGYKFDIAYTSVLNRANSTLDEILKILGQEDLRVERSWRLNERHYGGLTGLDIAETVNIYGHEQVRIWQRSFDTPPPEMKEDHEYYEIIAKDERYSSMKPGDMPTCESLKLTLKRALPYWNDSIVPSIKAGKSIIIASHGNSLRGIVKYLDDMSDEAIMALNLPTGIPFYYELDENMKPVTSMKFIGSEETVQKAMAAVSAQG